MSFFGANFGNPALDAAYDLSILEEIEKDEKEEELRIRGEKEGLADE